MVITQNPANPRHFFIKLQGPSDTPYSGGEFELEMFLGKEYPMHPPSVRFLTPVFHPNVDNLGRICLDILAHKWSPALTIGSVLLSLEVLLPAPNPDDPIDGTVGRL